MSSNRVLLVSVVRCSDDLNIIKKTRDTKAAKLNAMRNACKKASKDVVVELRTLEKEVARPRAEALAKQARLDEARKRMVEAADQVKEFISVLGPENPTTQRAEEVLCVCLCDPA